MLSFEWQLFTAKVDKGSSVKFTWVIDDLENFTHEGESYSVVFKKPSQHKLKVTWYPLFVSMVISFLYIHPAS